MRVLLLCMPFASIRRPALGVSILKPALEAAGFECDLRYPSVDFARALGVRAYERIAVELPQPMLLGEWIFAEALYGPDPMARDDYVSEILLGNWHLAAEDVELALTARARAPAFIDEVVASVDWRKFAMVGFPATTAQNIASLAVAKRVKLIQPGVTTVFGGSTWDGEMGEELHRRFDFVDFVCQGEADESLPALAIALAGDSHGAPERVPGLINRRHGKSVTSGPAEPVVDLDALPAPDFDDFIAALRDHGLARRVGPILLAEASRGCWWATRTPCAFCGSPGCRRPFRMKRPELVLQELRRLAGQPLCRSIEIVDDVPPRRFFGEVLPALAADPPPVRLFCEVRPDVARHHVRLLGQTGADVQPGIESLNDHVLALMRKGSRALENVRLLRWCREHRVTPTWNFIYGVPGEDPEDYAAMRELLPAIRFLEPPSGCGPVRLDRFSAYWEDPATYGLANVRPLAAYRHLYPFPEASLRRIAYSFDYDWASGRDPESYVGPVRDAVRDWQNEPERGELLLRDGSYDRDGDGSGDEPAPGEAGGVGISDTREGAARAWRTLSPLEAVVYEACDDICARDRLSAVVRQTLPEEMDAERRVDEALAAFVAERLMIRDGDRYLSLALREAG